MRQKKGFKIRTICGENIIVAEGIENIDFSKIISMNESSAYLWQNTAGKEFSVSDLCQLLLDEYDVDEATATKDAEAVARQWIEAGIADE